MSRKKLWTLAMSLFAVMALVLSACGSDEEDASSGDEAEAVKVGLAYDLGGRGDKSFNDSAAAGLDRANDEFGVEAQEASPDSEDDRGPNLQLLAEAGTNPVIGVGFAFGDVMADIAAEHPDTLFGAIDTVVEADNVISNVFAEEQGSFLVGAAAALKSETGKLGFIGGVEMELIQKFEAGFVAGAKHVNPEATVEIKYISAAGDFSGFNAPDKAKEIAGAMYEGGVDVIFHAAGASGSGLFDAAVAADAWAIGVDSDQWQSATPEQQAHILTSMLKRVDVAVYETIKKAQEGAKGGETVVLDLKADGVGYATSGGYVDDIAAQLDELKADIVAGTIEVPVTPGT